MTKTHRVIGLLSALALAGFGFFQIWQGLTALQGS